MTVRTLVDTNVLLYCYDRSKPDKQQQALDTLDLLVSSGVGALSTQILGEFFVNATRKLAEPMSLETASERIEHYFRSCTIFDVTHRVVEEAIRGVRAHQLNYWDAQIWAVARLHSIPVLLSEDFQDGRTLEGVRFLNPLLPGFHAAELLESI